MDFLSELWLPIVVSGLIVWFASFLMHVVLPHHKGEWKGLPNEEAVMGALKGVPAGQYMFPYCADMSQMKDPAMQEKIKAGPSGHMTVWAGPVNMGQNLGLSLLVYVLIGVFVGYVAWHAMEGEAQIEYMRVFRIAGTAAFMAHGLGILTHMVWFKLRGFWTYLFDNLVYGLLTAGVFGWLWPG
jgi:hypothetical protein